MSIFFSRQKALLDIIQIFDSLTHSNILFRQKSDDALGEFMKKIFVSPLLVALTSHTFASGYACKEVFKSKLEKVELKRGIRKAAIVDATVVAGLGGASVFIATSGLLAAPFAVIVLGGINGASIAVPTNFVEFTRPISWAPDRYLKQQRLL